MGVTDIVSNMNLDVYPIIALILFLTAFGIIIWGVLRIPKSLSEHQAHLPLEDDASSVVRTTRTSIHKHAGIKKGMTHG